ncbi:MAG: T9SS type A sorting domain-containing protein [Bacteroidales bacterium]|nr:T9SS type A sorting domain-containing protein [Bacteroidales bacterium]
MKMSFEKIFCWVVCLFFMAMPAMSVSFTIGDFKYDVTDTTGLTVSVSAASDTIPGKITIPDKIEYEGKEYSVTAIGEGAFKECAGLTSVIIPNSVASIGKNALHVDTVCCLTESDTIRIIRDTLFIHNLQEFISYKILAAKGVYMNAILEADIDLSSVCGVINGEQISWTPIRMSSGSFDGGNHTISNLYINQPNNKDNLALFDTKGSLSYLRIKNLKVTNAYVKGGGDVAGIAIDGFFINCHFEGIVIGQYAGGVNEYGKGSDAYNCSNYGLIVSSEYSIGVAAANMYNCYNRGRIVSDKSVAGSYTAAVGLGMYCCTQFNLYNAGDVYSPDPNSISYIQTSSTGSDYGNLFALQQMDSIAFLSGAVKDSLNMYVSQNPKSYDRDSVPLLSWVQGEDGFPRFEGVDLQPTHGYVVHFKGAINDYEVSLDGTIALPVCSVKGRSYVFSDNFDGKNIVCDTVVTVEMIGEAKKDSIWGLDMSDIANIDTSGYITLSFYSNVERERVYGIGGDFFYNNELSSYFYTNTYSSKAGVTCDYVQENDSVYKITLHNVYFYSQDDSLLIWMDVEHYNQKSNILKWEKKDTTQSLPVSGQIAGHDYIDLGLPSGTLWATYNVGATKPTEFGDYFAWGETEPKDVYDWNTYKYCTAYLNEFDLWKLQSITKYNFGNEYTGTIDNQSILLSEDDAATANWGKEWVMPTIDDLKELSSECYIVWTNDYSGAKGIIVYKAKRAEDKGQRVESTQSPSTDYSIADAHIFLPAQGFREGLDVLNVGSEGGYWLSSLDEKEESHSYLYLFSNENGYWEGYVSNRYLGCPVRAVSKPEASEVSDIISQALQVYVANGTIYVVDAQPNAKIQVFEMNGKIVASGTTDANGSAEIKHSASKGVYVVTDGNQSTKVVIK